MRLWLDGQCLQTSSRLRGIGRYALELIRAIGETSPDIEMSISFNATMREAAIAARGMVGRWIAPDHIHVWQAPATIAESRTGYSAVQRLNEAALAHHVACLAPDIALSLSPFEGQDDLAAPLLRRAGHDFPCAAIFYDAIPHRYPARYLNHAGIAAAYRRRLEALHGFDLLLAISDFARREAVDLLPSVAVTAINAGVSPDFISLSERPADAAVLHRLGIRKPFLLNVGALDWRKNVMGVVEAFTHLPPPWRETLQFVLAGDLDGRGLGKVQAAWAKAGLPAGNLCPIGHIDDAMLVQLYKQADLVIQPSLMEGFGLTALEAMRCGAPVVAANAGALPEVVGDARALFDPQSPQSIAARIAEVLGDHALARSLVEQGFVHEREFSWAKTARLAVEALKAAAQRKPAARHSLDELRQITLAQLEPAQHTDFTAEILAAAEPRAAAPARLLIDVTSTTGIDHGTGIQRVVNNIARALAEQPKNHLFWCESLDGFSAAQVGAHGRLERLPADGAHHIIPGSGDHILMLDSSWIYPHVYTPVMRRARLQGCEITTVLYDLVPLKMPAFCEPAMPGAFARWLTSALGYSTGFVCISRTVADELLALLEAIQFPRPIKVGYWRLGADMHPGGDAGDAAPPADAPEFLMVGTLEPRKGYGVAIAAFTQLWAEGFAGHLVIIGKRGWEMDYFVDKLKAHPQWGRKLHWLEGASDVVLRTRYAACTALINSSYGEGFGVPILEAAFHGKPAIASDLPVFREIADGVADVTYFPPGSASGLADAVRAFSARAAVSAPPADALVTWTQSAAQIENVLRAGNWYRHYQPQHASSDIALDNIGELSPPGPARPTYRLELVEGPIPSGILGHRKVIVRVVNLDQTVWSGAQGLALGTRLLDKNGKPLSHKDAASKIPLVQPAGDAHYMAVVLDRRGLRRKPQAVEIALFVGDEGLWDTALKVEL